MMDHEAGELLKEFQNGSWNYSVQKKKKFQSFPDYHMSTEDKNVCFDFAYGMSYGEDGEHRAHRTGGTLQRTKGQIFINTFQGKMAEFAVYNYLQGKNIKLDRPDTEQFGLGQWDSFDLICQGKHLSVKSTKGYGNLLLLETQDWNENGEYIPNKEQGTTKYDYTFLVRFSTDGEKIMKDNRLFFQKENEIPANIRDTLIECIRDIDWGYDLPGFIYHSELVKMIRDEQRNETAIPRGALLNGHTRMDAENYYFQAGNMHPMWETYIGTPDTMEEHSNDLLKRTCQECGGELIIKNGRYGRFWGCTDYPECRYTEDYSCPECGGRLVIRKGRYGRFRGCTSYPECRYTEDCSCLEGEEES